MSKMYKKRFVLNMGLSLEEQVKFLFQRMILWENAVMLPVLLCCETKPWSQGTVSLMTQVMCITISCFVPVTCARCGWDPFADSQSSLLLWSPKLMLLEPSSPKPQNPVHVTGNFISSLKSSLSYSQGLEDAHIRQMLGEGMDTRTGLGISKI